jgi:hypothetical protein
MKLIRLSELFDGLVSSVVQGTHPAVSADDGLDQALVVRAFWTIIGLHHGCSIPDLDRPSDFDFLGWTTAIGDAR